MTVVVTFNFPCFCFLYSSIQCGRTGASRVVLLLLLLSDIEAHYSHPLVRLVHYILTSVNKKQVKDKK